MAMDLLVIGGGGREHALVWKLAQSSRVGRVHGIPGNPGIAEIAAVHDVAVAPPFDALIAWVRAQAIGLTVVGPEVPLAEGIVDAFEAAGLRIFGPTRAAAQIEASKAFAKDVMAAAGVPTAEARTFSDEAAALAYLDEVGAPIVVKADGLAAGKGVTVAATLDEAQAAVRENLGGGRFGAASASVVIEECLRGREVSVFALCDGRDVVTIGTAEDHKQVFDGDRGPNTGGMGAYAPSPLVDAALLAEIEARILRPTVAELARRGALYRGVLYAGLILTDDGPKVIEFNCRFGDPETQVVLRLLRNDLLDLFEACLPGGAGVAACRPAWRDGTALCVVMASGGYPGEFAKGKPIAGLEAARGSGSGPGVDGADGVEIFHAGTKRAADGSLVTSGGRVLAVSVVANDLSVARVRAYAAVDAIAFEGAHFRRDIGCRTLGAGTDAVADAETRRLQNAVGD